MSAVLVALVGVVILFAARGHEEGVINWATQNEDPQVMLNRAGQLMLGLGVLIVVPGVLFSAHLWWLGERIARAGRFPPPGLSLVRDTPILEGAAAVRRARIIRTLAGALVFSALFSAFLLFRVWATLADALP
jgi:hypothetical protein